MNGSPIKTRSGRVTLLLYAVLLAAPGAVNAQFIFTTNNGAINIIGYNGSPGSIVIPATTNGYPVTSIANSAFAYRGMTNVTIPNSVIGIGSGAFEYCSSLRSVTIPNGVSNIDNSTFYSCSSLTNVTIPNSVTNIGYTAFEYCSSLKSVTIPDRVLNVGSDAFNYCYVMTNVTVGGSVINLWTQPFNYCYKLAAITVNPTNAFYSSTNGVLFNRSQNTLIECPMRKAGAYTVPDSVQFINQYSFEQCTNLTSVTMGAKVLNIAEGAFEGCSGLTNLVLNTNLTGISMEAFSVCSNLTNVMIPSKVGYIGEQAFTACYKLAAITVDANNSWYSSVGGVLFDKGQTTLVQYPGGASGGYTIPNGVTSIADWSFAACNPTSVTIPDSVTSIGVDAFEGCTGMTNLTIGSNVTSIGGEAFDYCTHLTSVTIPDSVTSIGGIDTFDMCTGLITVTIGTNVTSLGWNAFSWCSSLTSIYFRGNAPSLDPGGVFPDDANATVYYLPGTTGWDTFEANSGLPTVPWTPQAQTGDGSFGVQTNQFGFNITWPGATSVVVEACTDLGNSVWSPVATNTLTGGSSYFCDPQWTNYPGRFYRLRSP